MIIKVLHSPKLVGMMYKTKLGAYTTPYTHHTFFAFAPAKYINDKMKMHDSYEFVCVCACGIYIFTEFYHFVNVLFEWMGLFFIKIALYLI